MLPQDGAPPGLPAGPGANGNAAPDAPGAPAEPFPSATPTAAASSAASSTAAAAATTNTTFISHMGLTPEDIAMLDDLDRAWDSIDASSNDQTQYIHALLDIVRSPTNTSAAKDVMPDPTHAPDPDVSPAPSPTAAPDIPLPPPPPPLHYRLPRSMAIGAVLSSVGVGMCLVGLYSWYGRRRQFLGVTANMYYEQIVTRIHTSMRNDSRSPQDHQGYGTDVEL